MGDRAEATIQELSSKHKILRMLQYNQNFNEVLKVLYNYFEDIIVAETHQLLTASAPIPFSQPPQPVARPFAPASSLPIQRQPVSETSLPVLGQVPRLSLYQSDPLPASNPPASTQGVNPQAFFQHQGRESSSSSYHSKPTGMALLHQLLYKKFPIIEGSATATKKFKQWLLPIAQEFVSCGGRWSSEHGTKWMTDMSRYVQRHISSILRGSHSDREATRKAVILRDYFRERVVEFSAKAERAIPLPEVRR